MGDPARSLAKSFECATCRAGAPSSLSSWLNWRNVLTHQGSAHSTFLFPVPSMLYSFGRLVDLGCQLDSYNVSFTPAQADALALASDWLAVGADTREAFAALAERVAQYLESDEGREFKEGLIQALKDSAP